LANPLRLRGYIKGASEVNQKSCGGSAKELRRINKKALEDEHDKM
jgi:hypothetical protein